MLERTREAGWLRPEIDPADLIWVANLQEISILTQELRVKQGLAPAETLVTPSSLEDDLFDRSTTEYLSELEKRVWSDHLEELALALGSLRLDELYFLIESSGRRVAELRWQKDSESTFEDLYHQLRFTPQGGFPRTPAFLIQRCTQNEMTLLWRSSPILEFFLRSTLGKESIRLHSFWIKAFAEALMPQIHFQLKTDPHGEFLLHWSRSSLR